MRDLERRTGVKSYCLWTRIWRPFWDLDKGSADGGDRYERLIRNQGPGSVPMGYICEGIPQSPDLDIYHKS